MPIDRRSYVPAYRQVADDLRERIRRGELAPGQQLPGEDRLASQYDVGKDTIRDALQVLRTEGLIRTVWRRGSWVRAQPTRSRMEVRGPARVSARMPTPEERQEHDLDEGVPVLVVERDGRVDVLPADRVELDVPGAHEA